MRPCDNILVSATGDHRIEISIDVKVDGPDVVSFPVSTDDVNLEFTVPVILEPQNQFASES